MLTTLIIHLEFPVKVPPFFFNLPWKYMFFLQFSSTKFKVEKYTSKSLRLSKQDIDTVVNAAFKQWELASGLKFTKTDGKPDIVIK